MVRAHRAAHQVFLFSILDSSFPPLQVAAESHSTDHSAMSTVVPFKSRGVRAVLREAFDAHIPMRLARERIQPGWIHGYVIGL